MNHILGEDRNQLQFLSLEQVVPRDSWARVIDFFVDMLPLDERKPPVNHVFSFT